ncbi:hypothetical protein DPMN_167850 [Dreissena polymorpha]|uniref:Uncharacterized protein n=1 Tax=Dreissena polymorpha TaxID=45954 RepID=A0A9D4IYR1_DREPO|nr:hypothetical protein DPMN_167850 [Dreissena polymorpha]
MTRGNVSRRQNQTDKRVRNVAKTYTQDAVREISDRKVDDPGYRAKKSAYMFFSVKRK